MENKDKALVTSYQVICCHAVSKRLTLDSFVERGALPTP